MITKSTKRKISGILLLNKPTGITSHQALQITKRLLNASKAGHTGTLDPRATGLLPVCFGEATKFTSALLSANKTYTATLKLGYISSTGDADGEISAVGDVNLTPKKIDSAIQNLTGKIMQIPPMYSALKYQGKPLYTYARKGIIVERNPREITIYDLQVMAIKKNKMDITVKCSSGTYIRTLAEDFGKVLGCGGAYVTSLNRDAIGSIILSNSCTLDMFKNMSPTQRESCLHPIDTLLQNLPSVFVNNINSRRLLNGQTITDEIITKEFKEGEKIRVYDDKKQLLGIGEISKFGSIAPKRLIATELI